MKLLRGIISGVKTDLYIRNIKQEFQEITNKLKPNPNNFPIVDKWNYYKVFLPNRNKLFALISDYLENQIPLEVDTMISQFVDIKDINV